MNQRESAKNKLFRLIKVLYNLFFVFIIFSISVIAFNEKPIKYVDVDKSIVTCKAKKNVQYYLTAREKFDFKYSERDQKLFALNAHCNSVYQELYPEERKGLSEEEIQNAIKEVQKWRRQDELGIVDTGLKDIKFLDETDRYRVSYVIYWEPSLLKYFLKLIFSLLGVAVIYIGIKKVVQYIMTGHFKNKHEV